MSPNLSTHPLRRTSWWLPTFDSCECSCCEPLWACFCVDMFSTPSNRVAGPHGKSVFCFVRNHQTIFRRGCTVLQALQQRGSVSVAPNTCLQLVFSVCLRLTIWAVHWMTLHFPGNTRCAPSVCVFIFHPHIFFGEVPVKVWNHFLKFIIFLLT